MSAPQEHVSTDVQTRQHFRSPVLPIVSSPGIRRYLSPSLSRSITTRQRGSPSIRKRVSTSTRQNGLRGSPSVAMSPGGARNSVEAPEGPSSSNPKKRKLTSDLWKNDFTPIYDDEGRLMEGQCNYCDVIYSVTKKSGSSQCGRHLKVCKEKARYDEMIGNMQPGDARIPPPKRFRYDKEKARQELVRMIVLHEFPFRIVEYEGFRRFLAALNPAFKPMSRTTIKNDCMAEFHKQGVELLEVLKNSPSRVSLTADLWTSNQELGYICITCHFVDNTWKLQKKIIKFASVATPHDARNLLNVMLKTIQDWGIEDKIFTIALDNASVNDLMVSYVKSNLLGRRLLVGNGELLHHRCGAHVLNLIVQEGFKVSCGAIDAIRDCVLYLRSSPHRKQRFDDIVAQLGITCEKKIPLDVSTRWNSTYIMTSIAGEYILAFDQLALQDPQFKCAPTVAQWKIAEEICKLLEIFNDATVVLSGSQYPTINTYFNEIWKVKWMLGKEASNANSTIRSMVIAMKKKFLKYWRLSYLTICIPVILDPRCKYKFLEFNLKDELEMEGPKCLANVKRTFRDMFNAYSSEHGDSNIGNEQQAQASPTNDPWTSWSQHVDEQQRHRTKHSELENYLKEELVNPNTPIDILQWWMVNRRKYPTISRMARDILAIPASTVASESAFSTGSRVISDYRSRLNSETVDALICLQDWMRPSAVSDLATIPHDLDDDEILGAGP